MKKAVLMLSVITAMAGQAQADTLLGIYAGYDGWRTSASGSFADSSQLQTFNFADDTQASYFIALEHPVPLLPNIRIQRNELEASGTSTINAGFSLGGQVFITDTEVRNRVDLSNTDYVLYYEILDNDLISIDLGINGKHIKGDVLVEETSGNGDAAYQSASQWVPMLYSAVSVGLPLTGLEVFAQGSYISYDGSSIYDAQAGVAYTLVDNLALDMTFKLGYRAVNLNLDDIDNLYADLDFKGVFAGIAIHF